MMMNIFIVGSNEIGFYNIQAWYNITYAEAGLQGVICLCYAGMVGGACVAVHRWRRAEVWREVEREVCLRMGVGGLQKEGGTVV